MIWEIPAKPQIPLIGLDFRVLCSLYSDFLLQCVDLLSFIPYVYTFLYYATLSIKNPVFLRKCLLDASISYVKQKNYYLIFLITSFNFPRELQIIGNKMTLFTIFMFEIYALITSTVIEWWFSIYKTYFYFKPTKFFRRFYKDILFDSLPL